MTTKPPRAGSLRARVVALVAEHPGAARAEICAALSTLPLLAVRAAVSDVIHAGHVVSRGYGPTGRLYVAGAEPPPFRPDRAAMTADQYRKRVKHGGSRSRTLSVARDLTRRALRAEAEPYPDVERPRVRRDCEAQERPCPFVSCKHHLYLDVNPKNGTIKVNFPDREPDELVESCSLDVAERSRSLEAVGELMNLTRERVRQIEVRATRRLRLLTNLVEDQC